MHIAHCMGGIVAFHHIGRKTGGIAIEIDVLEPDVAYVVAWSTVVFLREVDLHIEKCGTHHILYAYVFEMNAFHPVLVTTTNSKDAIAVG